MPLLVRIERMRGRAAKTTIRRSTRPSGNLKSGDCSNNVHSWFDPYQAGSEESPHHSSGIMFRHKSNLFSALSEHENVPIGVILDLFKESPVLGAVFGNEASHGNDFPDPPVLSVHAGAAIRAGRISLATPRLHLSGLLVLYF